MDDHYAYWTELDNDCSFDPIEVTVTGETQHS